MSSLVNTLDYEIPELINDVDTSYIRGSVTESGSSRLGNTPVSVDSKGGLEGWSQKLPDSHKQNLHALQESILGRWTQLPQEEHLLRQEVEALRKKGEIMIREIQVQESEKAELRKKVKSVKDQLEMLEAQFQRYEGAAWSALTRAGAFYGTNTCTHRRCFLQFETLDGLIKHASEEHPSYVPIFSAEASNSTDYAAADWHHPMLLQSSGFSHTAQGSLWIPGADTFVPRPSQFSPETTSSSSHLHRYDATIHSDQTFPSPASNMRSDLGNIASCEYQPAGSSVSTPTQRSSYDDPPYSGRSINQARLNKNPPTTFQCDFCSKSFTRSTTLRDHRRTHTDERPHECPVCSKSFGSVKDCNRHKTIHTGKKNFICKGESWGCARRFARADSLVAHFRSQRGMTCIKPLLEGEALKEQRLWQEQRMREDDAETAETGFPGRRAHTSEGFSV